MDTPIIPGEMRADTAHTATMHEHAAGNGGRLERGTLLGRYVVVDLLGFGGMGTVYLAYDVQLARRVALKVLRPGGDDTEARTRLLREAQAMARLAHPNVVAVHDVGALEERVFLAMEYIEGTTLGAWLREAHPWRETLPVLKAAGRGLAAAHAVGIVHRDFKPANVLLGKDGRVLVADFGIARGDEGGESIQAPPPRASASSLLPVSSGIGLSAPPVLRSMLAAPLTETGSFVGTTGYMSPERAFEDRDDERSDQFAFCVTLYLALYGRSPFQYNDFASYLKALRRPPLPPPAGTRVPAWLRPVIERGLSVDASKRFASMTELLDALEQDPTRRRRGWIGALAAAAVAGAVAIGVGAQRQAVAAECRAGEGLVTAVWGPAQRADVAKTIAGTGVVLAGDVAARAQRLLDGYAQDWAHAHREASEATLVRGDESAATLRARLACLDGEREELSALVALLARADAVVATHALNAIYGLRPPRACLARPAFFSNPLPTEAPPVRVAALRRAVAEAQALRMAAKCDDAIGAASRALEEARALPHPRSVADLQMIVAECTHETRDTAAAREAYERLLAAAEAIGDDSLSAFAAARLAFEFGNSLTDFGAAERWLAIAKGIRTREGADERADAEILEGELAILSSQGHPDRSLPLRDRLIALLERIYGASHPRLANAINNRACDLQSAGKQDLAVAEFRRAIAMQEVLFGPDVPSLSIDYNNVGSALTELGRYDEAREAILRALALVSPLGSKSPHDILPLASLAVLEDRAGHPEQALRAADRGIAIVEASGESEIRYLPCLLVERGRALVAGGDAAEAQQACQRALGVQEAKGIIGPDKIYQDDALACLGTAELALGKTGDALAHLERSVSLPDREVPADLARARFALARALTAAKRDPRQATALAQQALMELRAAPGVEREAAEVERWLQEIGSASYVARAKD